MADFRKRSHGWNVQIRRSGFTNIFKTFTIKINTPGHMPVPGAFPTGLQNPSELEANVSFHDDYIKWGRIDVRW